jgi:uncharacterized protein YggE
VKHLVIAFVLVFAGISALCAQDVQVNRQNKTIAVTADESVTADAEVAVLEIGYHNYATTQEQAFEDNVHIANGITKALLDAGIPKANVETEKLRLGRTESPNTWTQEIKRERQFEAQQSWEASVSAGQAQAIVDLAVRSGANEVDDVDWNVIDPLALQAKAGGAALAKARGIADQMAKELATKLGELIYASNRAPVAKMWRGMQMQTVEATVSTARDKMPKLTLFPQKVRATLRCMLFSLSSSDRLFSGVRFFLEPFNLPQMIFSVRVEFLDYLAEMHFAF